MSTSTSAEKVTPAPAGERLPATRTRAVTSGTAGSSADRRVQPPSGPTPTTGRTVAFSRSRQSVRELVRFSEKVPAIPQLRRASIPRLTAVRAAATVKVSWPILFFKAYGRVCARHPQLRQVYVRWPWTRLYEHAVPVGRMTLSRPINGEDWLFLTKVSEPGEVPLTALDDDLRQMRFGSGAEVDLVSRQERFAKVPAFLKRLGFLSMLWSGRWRTMWLGTYGVTTVSKFGAVTLRPPVFNTTMLSFGPVSADGAVDIVLTYDHRVIDGALNAQAMAELEEELETHIADELEALQPAG